MWPFRTRIPSPKSEGLLGYFHLTDWWQATFTEEERHYIETTYKPFSIGSGDDADSATSELTHGQIDHTTQTAAQLLWGLATWFRKPTDRHLAHRILAKAEEVAGENILDLHFTYAGMIQVYYRDRDSDSTAFDTAIRACEQQIALAPQAAQAFRTEYPGQSLPGHGGFHQLAIIREKQKEYVEAIRLAQMAQSQGWAGDWAKRITRCQQKLDKQG
jgi:hypothetical protein